MIVIVCVLSAAAREADDVGVKMEAPEYLDLDEIDFSDDSVVSTTGTS